jgi:hypothetical protein
MSGIKQPGKISGEYTEKQSLQVYRVPNIEEQGLGNHRV